MKLAVTHMIPVAVKTCDADLSLGMLLYTQWSVVCTPGRAPEL